MFLTEALNSLGRIQNRNERFEKERREQIAEEKRKANREREQEQYAKKESEWEKLHKLYPDLLTSLKMNMMYVTMKMI